MLYPKNTQPFSAGEFQNPSSEYRAAPFWAWNSSLNADDLRWQIEQLKKLGFGGFHMHVRTGLDIEYLGAEHMDLVDACVEKARSENMLAWLYDEDRWPSGAAGGLVTQNVQYRQRRLVLSRCPSGADHLPDARLLACFDINLDNTGRLRKYCRIGENDQPSGFKLYAYLEIDPPDPWFNNQTYANTLDPAAIREFIRITHERYKGRFAKDFGALIPAIFTDEPMFTVKDTLRFALDERDIKLTWTDDLPQTFAAAYNGANSGAHSNTLNLIDGIPELLWDLSDDRISLIRYRYHDHVTERFVQALVDQCGAWCASNNIMLTGHMMEEPALESQCRAVGEVMRAYRSFQLPGIDMLCDRREFTTAKQAQSASRQYGRPGVTSELYGVTNWDFDFRGHKLQGDWQAALGITVRVPHLSWVSMNGEAKRDYPGTFNYQAPWYTEYPYVENHFARLNTALTRGRAVTRVGVIHPIESYWLHWGPRENTQAIREQMDRNFQNLCDWLLRGLIDFDYICESTLPRLCEISDIRQGNPFPVGKTAYDIVLVPAMETIRNTTLMRLEAFKKAGGSIIFLGAAPEYEDAQESGGPRKLWEQCIRLGFERLPLLNALSVVRELEIRDSSGAETQNLLYQLREEENGCRWLFIAHADSPGNPDIPHGENLHIRIRGRWEVSLYDTTHGIISNQPAGIEGDNTIILSPFYDHDSLLFGLTRITDRERIADKTQAANPQKVQKPLSMYSPETEEPVRFTGPVPVTLHEPNVLLLDLAEFALDDKPYRHTEEILRIDTIIRTELGWPLRKKVVAQPWVENDTSTPHKLRLRYTFESTLEIFNPEIALENAANTVVTLNGNPSIRPAQAAAQGNWYVDRCIEKVKLPPIKKGINVLELVFPYGRKTDLEAAYLLGDFGVNAAGTRCTLTEPVRQLAFGDITRQGLPFYGGNITYHLEAEIKNAAGSGKKAAGSLEINVSCYRGMLLRVRVDGDDKGIIAYSPYRLAIGGLKEGTHKIELVYYGCRINTFGQVHNNIRDPGFWWGPDSWRSEGPAWTYEYKFWPQGILKSPEISG